MIFKKRNNLNDWDYMINEFSKFQDEFVLSKATDVNNILKPIEIIKNNTYVENLSKDKEQVLNTFSHIESIKDKRIESILSYTAIYMLKNKTNVNSNFKLVVSEYKNIYPFLYNRVKKNEVHRGVFLNRKNAIYVGIGENPNSLAGTIIHEMLHKIFHEELRFSKGLLNWCCQLKRALNSTVKNYNQSIYKDDFINNTLVSKFNKLNYMKKNNSSMLEEIFADYGKLLIYASSKGQYQNKILDIIQPLTNFFDNKIFPDLIRKIRRSNLNTKSSTRLGQTS